MKGGTHLMEEVDIRVSNMGVGKVRLDPAEIRGEALTTHGWSFPFR
jgi:hypothetical protein